MKEEGLKFKGTKGKPLYEANASAQKIRVDSWRIFRPVIDYKKCIKCKTCYTFCPEGAIAWKNKPTINYFICKGCLICFTECPSKAIYTVKED